jgi:carbamoyltransferase
VETGRAATVENRMSVLGVSSFDHDTAAALLQDGRIAAAIENDKLARTKTQGLPQAAIRFCVGDDEAAWKELSLVAVASSAFRGWLREAWCDAQLALSTPVASVYHQFNAIGQFRRQWEHMRALRRLTEGKVRIVTFDHHLCHAASSFYGSPFERALIVTMDENGDGCSGLLGIGEKTRIRVLQRIPFPHSLAWLYSQITELAGFSPHKEEYKTQWFGLTGKAEFKQLLLEVFGNSASGVPRLDLRFARRGLDRRLTLSPEFYRRAGLPSAAQITEEQRQSLARSVQQACCDMIVKMVEQLRHEHGELPVCFGGGLFQNSLLVASLEERLGAGTVFVPPAPGNSGTAVGAALLAWHDLLNRPRVDLGPAPYWGPRFTNQEAKDILDNCKARYVVGTTDDRKIENAVRLLDAGKIIGWMQGGTEFGPRALGNRSLLASPWAPYVTENLNEFIKHREWFRPFAISIPEEDCARYFEASRQCQFMNSLGRVRSGVACLPESFLLPDGYVRLHVVKKQNNPLLWRLLKHFAERAPAPMLVNTSFNLFGEPLVVTPRDAVRSYFGSGIDALFINNFVLTKSSSAHLLEAASTKHFRNSAFPPVPSPVALGIKAKN